MKLHLETKCTISNIPPKINPIKHKNFFIYYNNNNVIITELSSNKILHKFKYEDVQVLEVHKDHLYICTNDIYIVDFVEFEIVEIIKLSKALISKIVIFENQIFIEKINKKISLLTWKSFGGFSKTFELQLDSFCDGIFLNNLYFGYFNSDKIVAYSGNNKIIDLEIDNILAVHPLNDCIYLALNSGILLELIADLKIDLNISIQSCYFSEDHICCISNNMMYRIKYTGDVLDSYNIDQLIENYSGSITDCSNNERSSLSQIKKIKANNEVDTNIDETNSIDSVNDISDENIDSIGSSDENTDSAIDSADDSEIEESSNSLDDDISTDDANNSLDSSTDNSNNGLDDDNSIDNSEDTSTDNSDHIKSLEFNIINSGLIKTSENDYLLLNDNKIIKIISFVDDITDSIYFNDYLILTTSSGYLKYTKLDNYLENEYICDSKLVKIHKDTISAGRIYKDIFITSCKDRTIAVFKILISDDRINFVKIYEFGIFSDEISTIAYENNLLVVGTADFIVQIFKSTQNVPENVKFEEYSNFFSSFENISVQKLHSKSISHISLTKKYIITSSFDKSCKILDLNGNLIKTIQSDKIIHTSYNDKYIAICSHKAVKILSNPSLSPICSFTAKRPVLSSCFYNDHLLTTSDVLRIFDIDKKKCVKNYDFGLVNSWSFNFPFISAENKILILKDNSKEVSEKEAENIRQQKENTMLFDKFIYEKKYDHALSVVLKSKDDKKIHQVITQGYFCNKNIDFMVESMKNGEIKSLIFDVMMKNCSFKNSLVFNEILNRFYTSKVDKIRKDKIRGILKKHTEAIDNIYIEFLGYESL